MEPPSVCVCVCVCVCISKKNLSHYRASLIFLPPASAGHLHVFNYFTGSNKKEKEMEVLYIDNYHWWSQYKNGEFFPQINNLVKIDTKQNLYKD
jgi:hypothetical protein